MTSLEAAAALDLSLVRVQQLLRKGYLRGEKRGRDWWIEQAEVERFKALDRPQGWPKGRRRKQS